MHGEGRGKKEQDRGSNRRRVDTWCYIGSPAPQADYNTQTNYQYIHINTLFSIDLRNLLHTSISFQGSVAITIKNIQFKGNGI